MNFNHFQRLKIKYFIQLIRLLRVTLAPFWRVSQRMRMLWSERKQCISSVSAASCAYVVYVQIKASVYVVILSKMAPGWRGGDELLSKVIIFVFFAHKKYSRSFEKLWLNHWCNMDYFNDGLTTFLDLDRGSTAPPPPSQFGYKSRVKFAFLTSLKNTVDNSVNKYPWHLIFWVSHSFMYFFHPNKNYKKPGTSGWVDMEWPSWFNL